MENLNLSLFDIFGFVIPGGLILIALLLIFKVKHQQELLNIINQLNATQLVFYVILSYMIGFLADNLSYPLFNFLGHLLRKSDYTLASKFSLENRAIIHFNSPENFQLIEKWNALTTFSYNLSFGFLVLSIYFIKLGFRKTQHLLLFILCLIFSGILLNKANMYSEYYEREVNQTVMLIKTKP